MNDKDAFLKVNNLVVEYTSEGKVIHAVNDVSFTLQRGKTLALVGETGAGKTTIAKSIIGVLPDRGAFVKNGSVELNGEDLLTIGEKKMLKIRGRKIAMVFQDPMTALNPTMRIGDQISEVIREHNHVSKKEAAERATEMLKMVGIHPERYSEYPHQFSGGMKQRVVIAIALACNPELLLADEPTTALDVTIQAQVMKLIKNLRNQNNTSMILITHDLGVVADIADDVAVIYGGEVLEYGTKEEVYIHPSHPYTRKLFKAIPNLEEEADRLANIAGSPPDPAALPEGCCFNPRCPFATDECRKAHPVLKEIRPNHVCSCIYWDSIKEV